MVDDSKYEKSIVIITSVYDIDDLWTSLPPNSRIPNHGDYYGGDHNRDVGNKISTHNY